jgi:hypothetical protein
MIAASLAVELGGGADATVERGAGSPAAAVCVGAMIAASLAVELSGEADAIPERSPGSSAASVCVAAMIAASPAVGLSAGTPPMDGAPFSAPADGLVERWGST